MPPKNPSPADEPFQEIETRLGSLRATAKSLREQRPSWFEHFFHPGRQARRQAEFDVALVAALKEIGARVRTVAEHHQAKVAQLETTLASAETRLAQVDTTQAQLAATLAEHDGTSRQFNEQFTALRSDIIEIRQHHEEVARQQANAVQSLVDRLTEMRQQGEQAAGLVREHTNKIEELVRAQESLGNEFRERIQHVLDEQRVAIRQLSLKASEDAILSDRARRATELKLAALAERVRPPKK